MRNELKQSKVIAYDCEGVRLSRTGKNHFVTNSYSGEDIPDRRDDGRWKGNLSKACLKELFNPRRF